MNKNLLSFFLLILTCYSCKNSEEKQNEPGKASKISEEQLLNQLIIVDSPKEYDTISSPLIVKGKARGQWFFEASFPVELKDKNFETIKEHFATAEGNWMTEEFVPFSDTLEFEPPATKSGYLILHKANPSGLPENADSDTVKVNFYQIPD